MVHYLGMNKHIGTYTLIFKTKRAMIIKLHQKCAWLKNRGRLSPGVATFQTMSCSARSYNVYKQATVLNTLLKLLDLIGLHYRLFLSILTAFPPGPSIPFLYDVKLQLCAIGFSWSPRDTSEKTNTFINFY